jgi:hypothetical protein
MCLFWCIVSFLLLFRSTVLPLVCPTHLISVVSDPPLFSVLIYGNMHSYSNSLYLFMFWPYFASESYRGFWNPICFHLCWFGFFFLYKFTVYASDLTLHCFGIWVSLWRCVSHPCLLLVRFCFAQYFFFEVVILPGQGFSSRSVSL